MNVSEGVFSRAVYPQTVYRLLQCLPTILTGSITGRHDDDNDGGEHAEDGSRISRSWHHQFEHPSFTSLHRRDEVRIVSLKTADVAYKLFSYCDRSQRRSQKFVPDGDKTGGLGTEVPQRGRGAEPWWGSGGEAPRS